MGEGKRGENAFRYLASEKTSCYIPRPAKMPKSNGDLPLHIWHLKYLAGNFMFIYIWVCTKQSRLNAQPVFTQNISPPTGSLFGSNLQEAYWSQELCTLTLKIGIVY